MKRILCSLLISFFSLSTQATSLQASVDSIINRIDPKINMGIMVVDLHSGETLYQRNAQKTFIPASNMKLFSDAAALLALGPDYRFQSKLSTDATLLQQGQLHGSIYLFFPGDPSFMHEDLNGLLAQLATWGIQRIQGNVVLVSHHQVVNPYAPGIVAKDLNYSYGAPIAPIMLDENRLTVTVNPGYRAGEPALVEYNAAENGIILDNQIKTAATAKGCGISLIMNPENHLSARGCIAVSQGAIQQRIPIHNPLRYTQELIKTRLNQLHITLDGQVLLGNAPSNSLLIATHESAPITQLMAETLKPSDNLFADSLFLHAAEKLHGSPVDWADAQRTIKEFLQRQTGLNLNNAVLIDGSGLSRQDLLTPAQTVGLLRYLHDRFPLAYEYISALPIAGQDGTLKKRFSKPNQRGLVRAKTGSMTGIMSLSGYLYTANAHTLAFAIYVNTLPGTPPNIAGRYRSLVDMLCEFFLQQKPDAHRLTVLSNPHANVAFQHQPSQADRLNSQIVKWRRIEYALKNLLKNQSVTIVYRGQQLMLIDHGANANKIWAILQELRKKYAFSVALHGQSAPASNNQMPLLLWVNTMSQDNTQRTWTLHESPT